MLIDKLKTRLGGHRTAFTDAELAEFIETATTEHGLTEGKNDALIVDLALCTCYLRLATDKATFFRYSQATEEVDKTATPKMFLSLYEMLWQAVQSRLPGKVEIIHIKKPTVSDESEEST